MLQLCWYSIGFAITGEFKARLTWLAFELEIVLGFGLELVGFGIWVLAWAWAWA